MFGPAVPIVSQTNGMVEIDVSKLPSPGSALRRSLYLLCRRNYQLTELSVFDQPLVTPNCTRRNSSATSL
jgi:hypothetical protein